MKIERRTFLLNAILAPFAGRLAAGNEPGRSFTEFIVTLADRKVFRILVSEDGDVEEVTFSRTMRMREAGQWPLGDLQGRRWRTFDFDQHPHSASIRFCVDGPNIVVDYAMATEQLTPLKKTCHAQGGLNRRQARFDNELLHLMT